MKVLLLQELLIRFLDEHLRQQRQVSPHTVLAYRDTFRLLLRFLKRTYHVRPVTLELSGLNPERVLAFLAHLEQQRANSVRSRNARLAAIRSFAHYAEDTLGPDLPGSIRRLLAIPIKRHTRPILGFLTRPEIQAVLAATGESWTGRRDYLLFLLLYNTGARISEILALRVRDVLRTDAQYLELRGKGRKYGKVVVIERCSSKALQRQGSVQPELSITTGCRGSEGPRRLAETESWQFVAGELLPVPAFSSPNWLRHRGGWF